MKFELTKASDIKFKQVIELQTLEDLLKLVDSYAIDNDNNGSIIISKPYRWEKNSRADYYLQVYD